MTILNLNLEMTCKNRSLHLRSKNTTNHADFLKFSGTRWFFPYSFVMSQNTFVDVSNLHCIPSQDIVIHTS